MLLWRHSSFIKAVSQLNYLNQMLDHKVKTTDEKKADLIQVIWLKTRSTNDKTYNNVTASAKDTFRLYWLPVDKRRSEQSGFRDTLDWE